MKKEHRYGLTVKWTGNKGHGTFDSRLYGRDHKIVIPNKPDIQGSSDTAFRGDKTKHNPEELLLAALSSCHMLWYLDLCSDAGVVVTDYIDRATGIMEIGPKRPFYQCYLKSCGDSKWTVDGRKGECYTQKSTWALFYRQISKLSCKPYTTLHGALDELCRR